MVKTSRCLLHLALLLLATPFPALTLAQQVPTDPTSTHIFPAGARRGTTVKVRVGGECLPPLTRFKMEGPGLKALSAAATGSSATWSGSTQAVTPINIKEISKRIKRMGEFGIPRPIITVENWLDKDKRIPLKP